MQIPGKPSESDFTRVSSDLTIWLRCASTSVHGFYRLSLLSVYFVIKNCSRLPKLSLSFLDLLDLLVFDDLFTVKALVVDTLSPLDGLDVFRELALHLVRPPNWQVALEDVIDLLESASSCLRVHEEDVNSHHRAEYAEDDV